MGKEIERKFLVRGDAWRKDAKGTAEIEQGYLARGGNTSVRVRIKNEATGYLTVKSRDPGHSRAEFEYEVPLKDAEALMKLCGDERLSKRRYSVPHGRLTWEIDIFAGRHTGLVIAEIELPKADTPLTLPGWIGDEVTDDPRYRNANIAKRTSATEA